MGRSRAVRRHKQKQTNNATVTDQHTHTHIPTLTHLIKSNSPFGTTFFYPTPESHGLLEPLATPRLRRTENDPTVWTPDFDFAKLITRCPTPAPAPALNAVCNPSKRLLRSRPRIGSVAGVARTCFLWAIYLSIYIILTCLSAALNC